MASGIYADEFKKNEEEKAKRSKGTKIQSIYGEHLAYNDNFAFSDSESQSNLFDVKFYII